MAIRVSGLNSGLDTDAIVKELVKGYSQKTEKYKKEQTKLGWKQDIWKDLNKKVKSFYTSIGNLRYNSGYVTKKTSSSDTTKATVSASAGAVNGTQKLHVLSTAQSGYLTGGKITSTATDADGKAVPVTSATKLSDLGITADGTLKLQVGKNAAGEKSISLTADSTISDVVNQLKEAGLNASFDEKNGRIYLSSSDTGVENDFSLTSDGSADSDKILNALGLNISDSAANKAVKIDGSDAMIVLNGVTYTSSTNNFSINGLSISVNAVTDNLKDVQNADGSIDTGKLDAKNAVSITTSTDAQGIYDKIKDFLTSYNNIINEITKLYNADSAKGYEPLTDDEKDQMSDSEVEKWETKIKDSLLRRDSNLGTVMNAMTSAMSKGVEINGKTYALSSFGISTLGYMNAAENE